MSTEIVPVEQAAQDAAAAKIAAAEEAVARAQEQAAAVEVTTAEEAATARQIVANFQAEIKRLEAERVELVKPLKDYTGGIDKKYKLAKAPLETYVNDVKAKLIAFNEEQEAIRAAEQKRLDEERQRAEQVIRERREEEETALRAEQEKAAAELREAEELAAEDPELRELVDEARDGARRAKTRADVISQLPAPALPRQLAPAPAKVEGATKRWDFEVIELRAVPDYLPDGTPLKAVITSAFRSYMHAHLKEHDVPPDMPGIRCKQVGGLSIGAAS